uniref:Uncharacterized protein n=1 Tax=Ascaris lumbricoides TaxID=6252 RepID=A0A0M3IKH1_ASCLU
MLFTFRAMGKQRHFERDFGVGLQFYVRLRLVARLLFPRIDFAVFFVFATLAASIGSKHSMCIFDAYI